MRRDPEPLRYRAAMAQPADPRVLVTGAYGCIGAWVVRELVAREIPVVTFDLGGDDYRFGLTMSADARRARAARAG